MQKFQQNCNTKKIRIELDPQMETITPVNNAILSTNTMKKKK